MAESDPHELADQLQQETERLQQEIERLGDDVSSTREDWEHKRSDTGIPGAAPADQLDEENQAGENQAGDEA
ncbi:MAG TPA: hypothetical protein VGF70_16235 [Solirubrobacteraceae bacterium]|jgi:hypothetical protein